MRESAGLARESPGHFQQFRRLTTAAEPVLQCREGHFSTLPVSHAEAVDDAAWR